MKIVVIGGDAAGMSAAAKARRADPAAVIEVYERGGTVSLSACGLPYYAGGLNNDPNLLIARTPEEFARMGIRVFLHTEAVAVDPLRRTARMRRLTDGAVSEVSWDRLMIAVGAEASPMEIPGTTLPGVMRLRTLEDGVLLHEVLRLPNVRHVAVVGGGAAGCEMAAVLALKGRQVTLVERGDRLLSAYEPEFSELAAQDLERHGVRLLLRRRLTAISETGYARIAQTDRETVSCDLVILAPGVRPATAFLRDTGLAMDESGALIVDDQMRTSLPDIYAAGDCAAITHRLTGRPVWSPLATSANRGGRVAGENLAGGRARFPGTLRTAAIRLCALEMARTGLGEAEAKAAGFDARAKMVVVPSHPAYYPSAASLTIKLIYEAGSRRLLGGFASGERDAVLRVDMLSLAIHTGMTADALNLADLAYAPPFSGVWDAVQVAAGAAK